MQPHIQYYRACVGSWSGRTDLRVTSFADLRGVIGFFNAFPIWMLSCVSGWIGRLSLNTSVRFEDEQHVVHTTALRWFGIPLLVGEETITLHADGRSFELRGSSRMSVNPFRTNEVSGTGEVSDDANHASYTLQFFGAQMQQETTRSDDSVTLEQMMPGYAAVHHLLRIVE